MITIWLQRSGTGGGFHYGAVIQRDRDSPTPEVGCGDTYHGELGTYGSWDGGGEGDSYGYPSAFTKGYGYGNYGESEEGDEEPGITGTGDGLFGIGYGDGCGTADSPPALRLSARQVVLLPVLGRYADLPLEIHPQVAQMGPFTTQAQLAQALALSEALEER